MHHILPSPYRLIDAQGTTSAFFSRYPAAISVEAVEIDRALKRTVYEATAPGTKERKKGLVRYSDPNGNPFAICHSSARPDRLIVLACIIEVMWIHDDVTEELEHSQACEEHSKLASILRLDIDPTNLPSTLNLRQRALAPLIRRAIDMDPLQAPTMLKTLHHYLYTFDSLDDEFHTMSAYAPYRISNCGYWISTFFLRWGLYPSSCILSATEYASIKAYDFAMGNVLGLTNDYFSWAVEKNQATDRTRNAVRVIMNEHSVEEDAARQMLLGIIVGEEARAARLKNERLGLVPLSKAVETYFDALELYVGGSCYWHATAERYKV